MRSWRLSYEDLLLKDEYAFVKRQVTSVRADATEATNLKRILRSQCDKLLIKVMNAYVEGEHSTQSYKVRDVGHPTSIWNRLSQQAHRSGRPVSM